MFVVLHPDTLDPYTQLQKSFPLSLKSDIIHSNACWEYASSWNKDIEKLSQLRTSLLYIDQVQNGCLRHGRWCVPKTLNVLNHLYIGQGCPNFFLEEPKTNLKKLKEPYFKAELNFKPAKLNWSLYLVPFSVQDNIPKCKKPQAPTSWQPPHTFRKSLLLIPQLNGQWSQIDLGIIWEGRQLTIHHHVIHFFLPKSIWHVFEKPSCFTSTKFCWYCGGFWRQIIGGMIEH